MVKCVIMEVCSSLNLREKERRPDIWPEKHASQKHRDKRRL